MIAQLHDLFIGINKTKNQLIILDMVEYIITNTLTLLVFTTTGFKGFLMIEQMKKIKNTLIELFLMVM